MLVNYDVDAKNRITSITTFPIDLKLLKIELPDDFDLAKANQYLVKNGELIYDPVLPTISTEKQIEILKQELADTDYVVIKIAEGAATAEEYSGVIAQRQEWRKQINKYEQSLLDKENN